MATDRAELAELDLGAAVRAYPVRRVILPLREVIAGGLGLGELLDVADAAGVPIDALGTVVKAGGTPVARVAIAIAWVIERRADPTLTLADAQRWDIRVVDGTTDPLPIAADGGGTSSS